MSATASLLTAQQRILLDPLRRRSPTPAEHLVKALYGTRHDGGPDNAHNVVRIQILRMRRRLERYGVRILTLPGRGYMVDPQDLPALEQLLEGSLAADIEAARASA